MSALLRILPDVQRALDAGTPVVALESSVLAQGLPMPQNREAARRMVQAVERAGAKAAITGVVRGVPSFGLSADDLDRFLAQTGVRKISARDIPITILQKRDGATTVAASLAIAKLAGALVFATGGIGGVHRGAPFDESADVAELASTPMVVVCAGAKSILDLGATAERLETLGVPVVGFRTDELPGFFTARTGIMLDARVDSAAEVGELFRAHRELGRRQAVLVVQPPPAEHALAREVVEEAVERAMADAERERIGGAALTPFLLLAVTRITGGGSLVANMELLEQNAELAGEIAVALSQ
ncbi:MAG TPA: pseudouridine-5'-phosphate glycosidase [Gemmatimonadaceae bacterium]|nr:pseudouridine-5'-phosphate glycosidase [Gemmatimonadaceae bacterium]